MRLLIIFLMILLPISSCKKEFDDFLGKHKWITYHIKEDQHRSTIQVATFHGHELKFLAKFDNTAQYTTSNSSNQEDINKLYGFSDCGDAHHENSARFGWRWINDSLNIVAYCYKDNTMSFKNICNIELDKEYEFKIETIDDQYVFSLNGIDVIMDRGCSNKGGLKYYLFPYFGGTESAPHDIYIKIKEL